MEIIQFVGACIGYTASAITLITLIVKPIRVKLISWMKGVNKTDTTAEALQRIEERLDKQEDKLERIALGNQASLRDGILQRVDECVSRGYITGLEKNNLIDMYEAYSNLGGDQYATDRYLLAKNLPQKN